MIQSPFSNWLRSIGVLLLMLACALPLAAQTGPAIPPRPEPPRLVNDLAGMLSPEEESRLETKLVEYARTSSTQITVVTVVSIGDYPVADYALELGRRWGVGQEKKNNGVVVLAARKEHQMTIQVGYGLEGVLTDALSGRIIRNEMRPAFQQSNFYEGFDKAADAIILATKGEYKADPRMEGKGRRVGGGALIGIILLVYFIIWIISKIGGGGGNYMSGRGHRGWGGGFMGGMGGGFFGGGGFGGGGSRGGGGGGFGGFGGGSFGGGGASGGW